MKKFVFLFVFFWGGFCTAAAADVPDNMYFRAMQDEMKRSLSQLRVKGSPKPYYLAYRLRYMSNACSSASLGKLTENDTQPYWSLMAGAVLSAGTPKSDSMGFVNSLSFSYDPEKAYDVPNSYWGIRRAFWKLTDSGYVNALDRFEKKQAYQRQKNISKTEPDFASAPQGSFAEEISPFPAVPHAQMARLVEKLSAQGKDVPYLEDFSAQMCLIQRDLYYLNSNGGFYQYALPGSFVTLSASLRNREGYKEKISRKIYLPADHSWQENALMDAARQLLADAQGVYKAQKPEPYLGPVLLMPAAAADFLNELLVANLRNIEPLLSSASENDATAGSFRNKQGMRIMSNVVEVYDKPSLRTYKGLPLAGFMPVDDEGVKAQDLTVVSAGRLQQLPLSRRSTEQGRKSNGHARMSAYTLPREALSNVWIKPKHPLSALEMEQKLLERCRELDLEYCYILKEFPGWEDGEASVNLAERIYTKDGHKEPVFGIKVEDKTTRSLRDILAAGSDEEVFYPYDPDSRDYSLITPSLLVDEIELMPDDKKPDRKPFIPKP